MSDGGPIGWLSGLSPVALFFFVLTGMVLAGAAGHIIRRMQSARERKYSGDVPREITQEGNIVGAYLGLLALLLAFTYSLSLSRYEQRRSLVTQEANAIGTAYLRAQLLDEPHRSRLSNLLVDYTANRIRLTTAGSGKEPYLSRNNRLLTEIWAAVRSARESAFAHGISTPLLSTFNEVIDLDAQRKLAWKLRMPPDITILLIVYLIVTAAVLGHTIERSRGRRAAVVLFVLFALSLSIIADLNQPMSGRTRESQEPMLMLLRSLRAQPPAVFDKFEAPRKAV